MPHIAQTRSGRSRERGLWVRAWGFVLLAAAAFGAAPATEQMPVGIAESEYDRLKRSTAWQEVPDFISPEAMAGLPDELANSIRRDFAERGRIQVQSDRYLDYDEERNIIYSNARTRIRFDKYMLEADRVLVHVPLQEIQAEGNVILRAWEDLSFKRKTDEIYCKSMVFNYKYYQGAANEVRGQHDIVYFKCAKPQSGLPAFQMVGRDEMIFRDAEFTTDDFPDPQYSVHTSDAVLVFNDRIFMRNALLRVRHVPVMFLPAYTRSLREPMPWQISFGSSSRLGRYMNVEYNFWHYRYEPSFENKNELQTRDEGHGQAKLDLFSKRGVGMGFSYNYGFDFDKHKGETELYYLPSDRFREVPGDRNKSRWQLFARHRSELRKDLQLQLNVDYMSDPEFYYDLYDPMTRYDRGRVPERRARAALTYWKDDYVARALFEIKERITRDRITNTAEPLDDDHDYDIFPLTANSYKHLKREGLPSDRYGRVTTRLPQLTFSTSHLRFGGDLPLFYSLDINAFNNLDKGLNFRSTRDDSYVLGLDIYQQLSYLFRFSERYTLLAQVGVGLGFMKRLDDSWHYGFQDFLRGEGDRGAGGDLMFLNANEFMRQDLTFVNDNTFLQGAGRKRVSLSDVTPGFVYADLKLRFQGRITDTLTANAYYILREGSKKSLGEFYESIGNTTAREDLYNYRPRKHWISGDLTYHLAYPDISMTLAAGRNLQGKSDIFPNEQIQYANLSTQYRNQTRTLRLQGLLGYERRQMRDPSDPFNYQRDAVLAGGNAAYAPVSRRWWVEGDLFAFKPLTKDPAPESYTDAFTLSNRFQHYYYFYSENQPDLILDTWIGRKIGQKYTVELGTRYHQSYGGLRDVRVVLTRDLHNALAQIMIRYYRTPYKQVPADFRIHFNITLKLPGPVDAVISPRARTLMSEQRTIQMAEDPLAATSKGPRQMLPQPVSAL